MADPVVHLTNGVPDSGTGNITTLGAVVTALGTPMQATGGSVTANAGTNLNTSALALETGGNLAATAAVAGTTAGAAVITDASGTLQQYLRGIVKLIAAGISVVVSNANANGSAADASSAPVAFSTEGKASIGALTETAPASDTASSGLNGRLQRIAQNITTLIAATLKVSLQAATSGGLSRSRTLIPNNTTAIVVKSGAGQLYKIRATNNSATIAYIKLYDATSATAGSGTPVDTIMIPANTSGAGIVDGVEIGTVHTTGITFIVTTGIADNDTGAPAANAYIVTLYYK